MAIWKYPNLGADLTPSTNITTMSFDQKMRMNCDEAGCIFWIFCCVPQTGRWSRLLATGFRAGLSSANCLTITVGSFQHAFFTGAWLRTTNQNAITTFDYCNFEANTLGGIPMPDGWHMFIVIKTCLLQLVKIGWNTWALIKPCEIAPKYERWA